MVTSVLENIKQVANGEITKFNCLSMGNSKLPRNVGIFNLLAVADCGNCSDCASTCYAVQAQTCYKETYKQRTRNSMLARRYPDFLKDKIIDEINQKKPKVIRIHESGDFISEDYVKMWIEIAKYCYDLGISIYSYTKMYDRLILVKELNKLENVNVINSIVEGYRNYGSQEYCEFLHNQFGCYICPDRHDGTCMVTCRYCLSGSRVAFPIHGNKRFKDAYESKIVSK